MALVPNGRFRMQEKQGLLQNPLFSFAQAQQDPTQKPKPDPRLEVEQQDIGGGQPAGQNAQQAAPAPQGEQPAPPTPQTPPAAPGAGVEPEQQAQALEQAEQEKKQMRSVFFAIVEKHFGVNPENALKEKALKNKEFGGAGGAAAQKDINKKLRTLFDVDIQNPLSPTPIMKGFFVVPNNVKGKALDYSETVQPASEFCKRFGLDAKSVKEDDGGWRYEFMTHAVQQTNDIQTGTSYDAVLGGGEAKAASSKSSSLFKTGLPPTLGEILHSRRDQLFEEMRKIAGK